VNVQTLRCYEQRGLLDEPPRSSSGYRAYPAEVLTKFIKPAEQLRFSLTRLVPQRPGLEPLEDL
jgi:DNA-binding transcriptional MerR regulator